MNSMNSFGDLSNQLQGQLDTFMGRLNKSNSPAAQSKRRGGEKGEVIPPGYREGKLKQFTPEQMDLFKELFSYLGPDSYLSRLLSGDESMFEEMEAPAWRQFERAQSELGNRFSQLAPGAMSAQRGGGFQKAAGQLSSDFAQDLASKRQQLQRQALEDLRGMSMDLLNQRPYEKFLVQKPQPYQEPYEPSIFDQILGGVGSFFGGAGQAVGKKLGNKFFG